MKKLNIHLVKILTLSMILIFFISSCTKKADDRKIMDNVSNQLKENKNYAAVNVAVKDGIVILSGMCEGDNCADEIEKKVKENKGVKKVENNITIDNTTSLTMRTAVQSILTKFPGVQADVISGVIVLRGNIDRENLQTLMTELTTLNPKKIDNQLVVK